MTAQDLDALHATLNRMYENLRYWEAEVARLGDVVGRTPEEDSALADARRQLRTHQAALLDASDAVTRADERTKS